MIESKMEEVIKILKKRNWTIGVMESCTGGAVANCITNIPGASDVFECGLVTYCNEAKIKAGVRGDLIEKYGVASKEVAEEMARKVNANVGVGVTGNLPGEVFVALRIEQKVESIKFNVESKSTSSRLRRVEARIEMKKQVVGRVVEMIIDGI